MTIPRLRPLITGALAALLVSSAAAAQPLGAFTWQMQPYCNRVTFQVVQIGSVFTLSGFDDRCGVGAHAAAAGVASFNADGTVNLGFSIITPEVGVSHVNATVDLSTLGGPWSEASGYEGTLTFNGSAPGDPRPSPSTGLHQSGGYHGRSRFGGGYFFATGYNGTFDAPEPMRIHDTLGRFGAGGFNGQFFNWPTGMINLTAAEDWTPTANGTRMLFWTTDVGSTFASVRMLVDYNGFVGIGTGEDRPDDRLHVRGDLRVGTSGTNGCVRNNNGGALIGVCSSDARFKRDIVAFADVLPRVAALRPVHFSWRADAFPDRAFGAAREVGLIAQEVEQALPELVSTDDEGYKSVDYSRLPLIALQAIRELTEKNDALAAQNAALERRLAALEARVK